MRVDPLAGSADLPDVLRNAWDLPVQRVEFLPLGEAAAAYRVDCGDGRRFHLKLVPPEQEEAAELIRHGFYLSLMRQLAQRDVLAVPRVVATRTASLHTPLGDALLVLTAWIDGSPIDPVGVLPVPVRTPLAHAVGALHAATGLLDLASAPAEDFALPFDAGLRSALARLEGDAPDELRRSVGPWRGRIEAQLDALHGARERARGLDPPQVVCHTDLHGGNLVLDARGTLWILDWEGARLAPSEQDLAGATNRHVPRAEFASFVGAYLERCRARRPEPDLFEFYLRRRCLEDLEVFLRKILSGTRGAEQDAYDLALIRSECLDWIERMEDDVGFVRNALSGVRT